MALTTLRGRRRRLAREALIQPRCRVYSDEARADRALEPFAFVTRSTEPGFLAADEHLDGVAERLAGESESSTTA